MSLNYILVPNESFWVPILRRKVPVLDFTCRLFRTDRVQDSGGFESALRVMSETTPGTREAVHVRNANQRKSKGLCSRALAELRTKLPSSVQSQFYLSPTNLVAVGRTRRGTKFWQLCCTPILWIQFFWTLCCFNCEYDLIWQDFFVFFEGCFCYFPSLLKKWSSFTTIT